MKFTKMHGLGNDYIYVNCFEESVDNIEETAIKVSDRHFGIGGDGLVLICPSQICDAKMRMFNADGSEGKMCGNAIRCVGKYLYDNKMVSKEEITIETLSGIKRLHLTIKDDKVSFVRVNMGKAILDGLTIPTIYNEEKVVSKKVIVDGENYEITCVSMGNPHCIIFTDDLDKDISVIGKKFEYNEIFPEGVNTEFVKIINKNEIEMRVWERGSGETLACGTGASATVVAATLNGYCTKGEDVCVHLLGGDLTINYTDDAVFMEGSATHVFDGEII